eukprot:gene13288-9518_t
MASNCGHVTRENSGPDMDTFGSSWSTAASSHTLPPGTYVFFEVVLSLSV